MPVFKKQELRSTFGGKCGAAEDQRGGHVRYEFTVNGSAYAWTKVSHGSGDVDPKIVGRIARQIGLTSGELAELVACKLDAESSYDVLRVHGPLTDRFL